MLTLEQLVRQRGALEVPDVVRVLTPAAAQLAELARAGTFVTPTLAAISIDGDDVTIAADQPPSHDARAQVKALGALIYESLSGLPPPADGAIELVGQRPIVAELVRRCLDDSHPARFQRVDEVGLALRALTGDTQMSAKPAAAIVDDAASRAGEVLGSYQLVRRLGDGGMGEVYLAKHTRLGREVALKLLKPEMAKEPEVVRRFFDEARVVNDIKNPHIVEVFDFVEEPASATAPGRVYCVMELLTGFTLADVAARQGPLPVFRVAHLMRQTCEALHAAHLKGVVHRDVKPENIFVTTQNNRADFVKLLDFGIARLAAKSTSSPNAHRTQAGTILGTPMYMAPEQAQGRAVDARTDLYAVGSVLYELLSGRPLSHETTTPAPLQLAASGEPVPRVLSELIVSCIDMEPARRPSSAHEVARLLHGLVEVSPTQTLSRGPSKQPLPFIVGGALALGLAAVATVMLWPTAQPTPVVVAPPPERVEPTVPIAPALPEPTPPAAAPPPTLAVAPAAIIDKRPRRPLRPLTAASASDTAALSARMGALKKQYELLVARHGETQLTSIERARVSQALQDYAGTDLPALATSLPDAEKALEAAKTRLER